MRAHKIPTFTACKINLGQLEYLPKSVTYRKPVGKQFFLNTAVLRFLGATGQLKLKEEAELMTGLGP